MAGVAVAAVLLGTLATCGAATPSAHTAKPHVTPPAGTQVGQLSAIRTIGGHHHNAAPVTFEAKPGRVAGAREPAVQWQTLGIPIVGSLALAAAVLGRAVAGRRPASSLLAPLHAQDNPWVVATMTGEGYQDVESPAPKRWRSWVAGGLIVATLVAATLLLVPTLPAAAAQSGGRVGGGSFGSARSFSKASSSFGGQSMRAPAVRGGPAVYAPSFFVPMMPGVGGYYGGWGWGLGLGWGFSSFFNVVLLMTMVYFVFNFFQGMFGSSAPDSDLYDDEGDVRGSVVKLQVGLLGQARALQKDLNRIAEQADTDTPEGLHFVLQEAVVALMRNPEYCAYGFSEGMQGLDLDRTEDAFNRESMSERSKVKQETLVNYGGVTKAATGAIASGSVNELIVVTLLVAVAGKLSLPPVTDNASLKEALRKLGGIRRDDVLAVEVLWTPQEEGDTLTMDEFIQDFPRLNRI